MLIISNILISLIKNTILITNKNIQIIIDYNIKLITYFNTHGNIYSQTRFAKSWNSKRYQGKEAPDNDGLL